MNSFNVNCKPQSVKNKDKIIVNVALKQNFKTDNYEPIVKTRVGD